MNLGNLSRKAVTSADLSPKLTTLSAGDMSRIFGGINTGFLTLYNLVLSGRPPALTAYSDLIEGLLTGGGIGKEIPMRHQELAFSTSTLA